MCSCLIWWNLSFQTILGDWSVSCRRTCSYSYLTSGPLVSVSFLFFRTKKTTHDIGTTTDSNTTTEITAVVEFGRPLLAPWCPESVIISEVLRPLSVKACSKVVGLEVLWSEVVEGFVVSACWWTRYWGGKWGEVGFNANTLYNKLICIDLLYNNEDLLCGKYR